MSSPGLSPLARPERQVEEGAAIPPTATGNTCRRAKRSAAKLGMTRKLGRRASGERPDVKRAGRESAQTSGHEAREFGGELVILPMLRVLAAPNSNEISGACCAVLSFGLHFQCGH